MPTSTKTKNNQTRRKNARKSTGPKTKKGKKTASQNAVKHGLYAKSVIISSPHLKEDPDEYNRLLQSLIDDFDPQTAYEQQLIEKIANCMWRQKRVAIAETAHIEAQLDDVEDKMDSQRRFRRIFGKYKKNEDPLGEPENVERIRSILTGKALIPEDKCSITLLRYEMRLDRQLTRTFKLLFQLEEQRNRIAARKRDEDARQGRADGDPPSADRAQNEDARLVWQEPSSIPATDRQVTTPPTGPGPDGTCNEEPRKPKNDETKLDLSKLGELLKDATIFVDP